MTKPVRRLQEPRRKKSYWGGRKGAGATGGSGTAFGGGIPGKGKTEGAVPGKGMPGAEGNGKVPGAGLGDGIAPGSGGPVLSAGLSGAVPGTEGGGEMDGAEGSPGKGGLPGKRVAPTLAKFRISFSTTCSGDSPALLVKEYSLCREMERADRSTLTME